MWMFASLVMLSMKYNTVHAATVQAFTIGTLLTTLPMAGQHGFDMAFTVSDKNKTGTHVHIPEILYTNVTHMSHINYL